VFIGFEPPTTVYCRLTPGDGADVALVGNHDLLLPGPNAESALRLQVQICLVEGGERWIGDHRPIGHTIPQAPGALVVVVVPEPEVADILELEKQRGQVPDAATVGEVGPKGRCSTVLLETLLADILVSVTEAQGQLAVLEGVEERWLLFRLCRLYCLFRRADPGPETKSDHQKDKNQPDADWRAEGKLEQIKFSLHVFLQLCISGSCRPPRTPSKRVPATKKSLRDRESET